jgi:hypothetical protein
MTPEAGPGRIMDVGHSPQVSRYKEGTWRAKPDFFNGLFWSPNEQWL